MAIHPEQLRITTLGVPGVPSPLSLSTTPGDGLGDFVPDEARVRFDIETHPTAAVAAEPEIWLEKAGPREMIFFTPRKTRAAIVTCGGLCPGINNVIRSIYLELRFGYGVPTVWGIRYGYQGLSADTPTPPIELGLELVDRIHLLGGTGLGSSRGPVDNAEAIDTLERLGVNILFCIGGDGTMRGAHALAAEVARRRRPIAVVGIPKTIDNDIPFVDRTFGFVTALEAARKVIDCAHVEALGAPNGISLVKLMGRHAGFIAAGATLASQDVNFTLVPEVRFTLDGPRGLLAALRERLAMRGHAVIVVAEGAGQDLVTGAARQRDASGNLKPADVCGYLGQRISAYFQEEGISISLKMIDPSYLIRSVPANSDDALLCDALARHAVHAAMAGKTDLVVGLQHAKVVHVPTALVTSQPKRLSPESELWLAVMSATGQPQWPAAPA